MGDQLLTMLYSVVLGAILCVLYDVMRAVRGAAHHNKLAVFLEDILFWVISAILTFLFLLARTCGVFRGYVAFSMAAGFLIARSTVS